MKIGVVAKLILGRRLLKLDESQPQNVIIEIQQGLFFNKNKRKSV